MLRGAYRVSLWELSLHHYVFCDDLFLWHDILKVTRIRIGTLWNFGGRPRSLAARSRLLKAAVLDRHGNNERSMIGNRTNLDRKHCDGN